MVQVNSVSINHDKKAGVVYIKESYPQAEKQAVVLSFNARDFFQAVDMVKEDERLEGERSIVDARGAGLTLCPKCKCHSVDESGWCYNGCNSKEE